MNDETRDLLAGEALGALSDEDRRRLERELAADPALVKERDAYLATVSALEAGVARTRPSELVFERVLADVQDAGVREAPPEASAVRARRPWVPRLAAVCAAAAAVVLVSLLARGDGDEPVLRADVAGTESFPDVRGTARLFAPEDPGGRLVLELDNLPEPPRGSHYEVWVLREEAGESMEAVGSFTPTGARADLELPLPGPGDFRAVDVSVEPDGGSPEHSGVSLAGGTFEGA